jgi:hypothetical protein
MSPRTRSPARRHCTALGTRGYGPLRGTAKFLVKRAAEQASGTRDFYERLAKHIDDPADRRRFTAATEELAEP